MTTRTQLIVVGMIIVIAGVIVYLGLWEIYLQNGSYAIKTPVTTNPQGLTTSNLTFEAQLNPELQEQLRTFSMHQDFGINKWVYGPGSNQVTLYANDIQNDSQIKILQGTRIGNYTIKIIHDAEFEKNRDSVLANLTPLRKDSRYHITSINMGTDPFGNPPQYFVEVWVDELTPENKKLDNTMIQDWKIKILKPSFDPENYKPLTISTITSTSPASTSS